MLEILVSLLSNVTGKIITHKLSKNKNADKYVRNLVKITISYAELADFLSAFKTSWTAWIESGCENYPNSDFLYRFSKIVSNLMDAFEDVKAFFMYENEKMYDDFSYMIAHKLNIFEVWSYVTQYNCENYSYDRHKKIIYIPNYSIILSETKPLSQCTESELKEYLNIIRNRKDRDYSNFFYHEILYSLHRKDDNYKTKRSQVNTEVLNYIPCLLPEKHQYYQSKYVMALKIPNDLPYVSNFLERTNVAVNNLNVAIQKLKDIIAKYSSTKKKALLEIIYQADKNMK